MILNVSKFTKILKSAYKGSGLRIHNNEGNIVIAGSNWSAFFLKETLPKEILGEVIKLIGSMPKEGEAFNYMEDGNQVTIPVEDARLLCCPESFWKITNIHFVTDYSDTTVVENESGEKNLVFTYLLDVLDKKGIEKDIQDGIEVYKNYSENEEDKHIVWSNGECTYLIDLIDLSTTDKRNEILRVLQDKDCVFI